MNCVAWSPDAQLVASGSLDTSIIIWSVAKPAKHIIIKSKDYNDSLMKNIAYYYSFLDAHAQSQITRVSWIDNTTIVSVGQDCNTKLWTITPF